MDQTELKNQATYIWDRLDDLSTSDPEAYKKFIEQQMKERDTFLSSPEPKLCFVSQTHKAGVPVDVYVNVCGWKRIPYPNNDTEPLKMMCGFINNHKETKSCKRHVTIPVALNDKALEELLKSPTEKVDLIKLTIELVKHEKMIQLSPNFSICKELFKGDFPADPKRLFDKNAQKEFSEDDIKNLLKEEKVPKDILSSPEALIKNLSTDDNQDGNNNEHPQSDFVQSFMKTTEKGGGKKLIEEVGGKSVQDPEYTLTELAANDNRPGRLQLRINLPLVKKTADCDLNISSKEVELEVPGLYTLKVSLPKSIDENKATAQFSKKSSNLTLTMPILNS